MNRTELKIGFMLVLLLAGIFTLKAQEGKASPAGERVELFTDRTLYIAGEKILFSAYVQSEKVTEQPELSRVIYCELITPDGNKISGNKYLINSFYAFGYLAIPEDITTGIYYVRAYTKVMRNRGPSYYHYTKLKIVNPRLGEVRAITEENYLSENISDEELQEIPGNLFLISADKSQYTPEDTVHISINGTGMIQSSLKGISLSVVPEYSVFQDKVILPENGQLKNSGFYYPETRSLSITGNLTDSTTGKLLSHTRVNLSILGQGRDFMAIRTDSAGRFFFSLPDYTGYRDLFLCSEKLITANPKILIDNDFCSLPVHIPTNNFSLTQKEREAAYTMAVNVQLGSYFKIEQIPDTSNKRPEYQAFYGKPNEILYIDKYIQLPTLEEYLNELPTLVKVRKRQGEKYFKVLGNQTGLTDFDPLVLVDLVAIDDPSLVLTIPPSSISRVEVVNLLYLKGDQTYGGIINIISKNGDFAGIKLPSSGIFINYEFLSDTSNYPGIYRGMPHTPDTRNTLFWEPQLILNKDNTAEVSYKAPSTPGRYLIILNAINSKGKTFRQTFSIEVKK
jgi:hypothetical protein